MTVASEKEISEKEKKVRSSGLTEPMTNNNHLKTGKLTVSQAPHPSVALKEMTWKKNKNF